MIHEPHTWVIATGLLHGSGRLMRLKAFERICRKLTIKSIARKWFFLYLNRWIEERCRITKEDEPKSPLGKALRYANQQWPKLIKILDYENTELDNNLIENKIRPLALGRKNYLFAGSHEAAQRIAMMYSFFGSCKAHNINPYDWLKTTLERIPDTKLSELDKLLPGYEV